jgi:hypothetical protein
VRCGEGIGNDMNNLLVSDRGIQSQQGGVICQS